MCESCVAETKEYGEVLPGIYLNQSTNDLVEGFEKDSFGLVFMNGPSFTFKEYPQVDLNPDVYNEKWMVSADRFKEELESNGSFVEIYKLVSACVAKGYDIHKCDISYWLFNYLGEFLKNYDNSNN